MQVRFLASLFCALTSTFVANPATAEIVIDYTHDTFFANNFLAKQALEKAVADVNAAVTTKFAPITNDFTIGTSGQTEIKWDWGYEYNNPTTGAIETLSDTRILDGSFRLFVGMRPLAFPILGQGGPGGVFGEVSGFISKTSEIPAALADAQSNHQHRRGGGPIMSRLEDSIEGYSYSFDFGPTIGNMWFDDQTLWHFDHTTDVAVNSVDFYSVALHETLHSIGYSTSLSWDELVDGFDWLGGEAIATFGTGFGLIDEEGYHLADGIQSFRLSDGMLQEAVMTASIAPGQRKKLTQLDLAILRDIGYSTITAVPEPASILLVAMVGLVGVARNRHRRVRMAA